MKFVVIACQMRQRRIGLVDLGCQAADEALADLGQTLGELVC